MPSITEIRRDTESTSVTVRGLKIAVEVNADDVTMDDLAALTAGSSRGEFDGLYGFISKAVHGWDLTGPLHDTVDDDDSAEPVELVAAGEVIPLTADCLAAMPFEFVLDFSTEIQKVVTSGPNPTKARARGRSRKR